MEGVIHQWIEDQYKDDSLVISSAEAFGHLQKIVSLNINGMEMIFIDITWRFLKDAFENCSIIIEKLSANFKAFSFLD